MRRNWVMRRRAQVGWERRKSGQKSRAKSKWSSRYVDMLRVRREQLRETSVEEGWWGSGLAYRR